MSVEPKPQSPGTDRPSEKPPLDKPKGEKPIGDPPNTEKPHIDPPQIDPPGQFTLEPGDHGRGSGPLHTEPLVKNSPQQTHYGRGTYGNDQFAAEHHDDFVNDRELPEGLCDPQGGPLRPTAKPKEQRYGRIGGQGKG
jgi:hypothetical protein